MRTLRACDRQGFAEKMPVIKVYRHGYTCGIPPEKNDHIRAKRGNVGGWSNSSTRSNTNFLRSIRDRDLTGHGCALTLTLKECPETHEDWKRLREAFLVKLRRTGLIRLHWVTEWQRRGVPHLHCAAYFNDSDQAVMASLHWYKLTRGDYGSKMQSQHHCEIHDSVGWFEYLSKHASRGVSHYQRSPENIPDGWKATGRMWGKIGDWPTDEPKVFRPTQEGFYKFRRVCAGLVKASARASGDRRRISHAKSMLRSKVFNPTLTESQVSDKQRFQSAVRGLSEWLPWTVTAQILAWLFKQGYELNQDQE